MENNINLNSSAFNIYSPEVVTQNGQKIIYFGGWINESDVPHDSIYRGVLTNSGKMNDVQKVYCPQSLYQVNDPVLVQMSAGYWIMYFTGNSNPITPKNDIYFATSWDGINWSNPYLLIENYWLPSVTVKDGNIFLYATSSVGAAYIYQFNLGISGVGVSSPIQINMPPYNYYWINVDVVYHPSINFWQMVGENLQGGGESSKFIDYLYSWDGVNWNMGVQGIINAPLNGSVRTPSMHPDSAYYVYYGKSPTRDGMSNQVFFSYWS